MNKEPQLAVNLLGVISERPFCCWNVEGCTLLLQVTQQSEVAVVVKLLWTLSTSEGNGSFVALLVKKMLAKLEVAMYGVAHDLHDALYLAVQYNMEY